MNIRKLVVGAFLSCVLNTASAVTIDFEGLSNSDGLVHASSSAHREDGFTVYTDSSLQSWYSYGEFNSNYAGSTGIFTNAGFGTGVYLYANQDNPEFEYFKIISVDIVRSDFSNYADFDVTFYGKFYDSRPNVVQTFHVNGSSSGLETFYFSDEFNGIKQLYWYSGGSPQAQFDNFVIAEHAPADTDGDGMPDAWELDNGLDPYADDSTTDIDFDQLSNVEEFQIGADPNNFDTDGDMLADGEEVHVLGTDPLKADTDGDQMPDGWEFGFSLDPTDPADALFDPDFDNLTNVHEFIAGTLPNNNDTDSDSIDDGTEISSGIDPTHADTDRDGLDDGLETAQGLDPLNRDTDGDGEIDGYQYGDIIKVSQPDSAPGGRDSSGIVLSADGRYSVFASDENNLVEGDTNDVMDVFFYDSYTGIAERLSVASDGSQANDWSGRLVNGISLDMTPDARYVVFNSKATNLDPIAGAGTHVYLRDRTLGTTEIISINVYGETAGGFSGYPSISDDGRFIAFESSAVLVDDDTNLKNDIYVYDRVNASIRRVSVSVSGEQGNDRSQRPVISANGKFVTFSSYANNLVEGDGNGGSITTGSDIFVCDLENNNISRVSTTSEGLEANGNSFHAGISGDGRFVTFYSLAENLDIIDTNGRSDVFIHDRATQQTSLLSHDYTGTQSANGFSTNPVISDDGSLVIFMSQARDVVEGVSTSNTQVYAKQLATGAVTHVSQNNAGAYSQGDSGRYGLTISADNRFIGFESRAKNLVPGLHHSTGVFVRQNDANALFDIALEGATEFDPSANEALVLTIKNQSAFTIVDGDFQANASDGLVIESVNYDVGDCNFTATQVSCNFATLSPNRDVELALVLSGWGSSVFTVNSVITAKGNDNNPNDNTLITTIAGVNTKPVITDVTPISGSVFGELELIDFSAVASDMEDGDISDSLVWTSSLDGALGVGQFLTTTLSVGTHTISVNVSDNDGGTADANFSITVEAIDVPLVYCTSSGNVTSYEWIASVAFAGDTYTSGNNGGYLDATTKQFVIGKSDTANFTLSPGFRWGSYRENWQIWIDLNVDGQFSESERVFRGSSNSALSGSFQLPANAITGETRMRVTMNWGGYASSCGNFSYGEVEDYTILVQ